MPDARRHAASRKPTIPRVVTIVLKLLRDFILFAAIAAILGGIGVDYYVNYSTDESLKQLLTLEQHLGEQLNAHSLSQYEYCEKLTSSIKKDKLTDGYKRATVQQTVALDKRFDCQESIDASESKIHQIVDAIIEHRASPTKITSAKILVLFHSFNAFDKERFHSAHNDYAEALPPIQKCQDALDGLFTTLTLQTQKIERYGADQATLASLKKTADDIKSAPCLPRESDPRISRKELLAKAEACLRQSGGDGLAALPEQKPVPVPAPSSPAVSQPPKGSPAPQEKVLAPSQTGKILLTRTGCTLTRTSNPYGEAVAPIPAGEGVLILDESIPGWYRVKYGEHTGYLSKNSLIGG